jgi:hypothetical protein
MIRGLHAMFYSSEANELRAFLQEKLGLKGTDVGDGWLIFDAPEADLGVHPTDGNISNLKAGANSSIPLRNTCSSVRIG